MQRSVAEFRAEAGGPTASWRPPGWRFLKVLDMLQEASNVQAAIAESRKARTAASGAPGHVVGTPCRESSF